MSVTVRDCRGDDLAAMAAMAEARRIAYEAYEPLFWKKAGNSADMGRAFFEYLLGQGDTISLLAESDGRAEGFLIATPARVPPVYEPGPTAMIDDFCVARPELWPSIGSLLLKAARARLRERGFSQIVVVCGYKDAAKTAFLEAQDLSLTSTWWTAPA
jgi:GNAT superfamily N-acetyltransferase